MKFKKTMSGQGPGLKLSFNFQLKSRQFLTIKSNSGHGPIKTAASQKLGVEMNFFKELETQMSPMSNVLSLKLKLPIQICFS